MNIVALAPRWDRYRALGQAVDGVTALRRIARTVLLATACNLLDPNGSANFGLTQGALQAFNRIAEMYSDHMQLECVGFSEDEVHNAG